MNDIISVCIEAAKEAGEFLQRGFKEEIHNIETKADRSLATNFDKEAERLIIDKIKQKFPSHGIIGEENGQEGAGREYMWIIDPLDGTHNFIRKINIFGVSIGVARGNNFVAGCIYLPMFDELYIGEEGNGAYKNNQKISVSMNKELAECTVSFDSNIQFNPELKLRVLRELSEKAFNTRMFGSSARQLTYLAEGKLDAIIEFDDHPWDFAAGACIVQEAGGKITTLQGGILTYRDRGFIASNRFVHQKIQELL